MVKDFDQIGERKIPQLDVRSTDLRVGLLHRQPWWQPRVKGRKVASSVQGPLRLEMVLSWSLEDVMRYSCVPEVVRYSKHASGERAREVAAIARAVRKAPSQGRRSLS